MHFLFFLPTAVLSTSIETTCQAGVLCHTPRSYAFRVYAHALATLYFQLFPHEQTIYLWPKGIIPFKLDSLSPDLESIVVECMQEWSTATGIQFHPVTPSKFVSLLPGDKSYQQALDFSPGMPFLHVRISKIYGNGGHATLGFMERSYMELGPQSSKAVILHELGHVIGLIHEHQRSDRDNYVELVVDNMYKYSAENYRKLRGGSVGEYDYESIMHYDVCHGSRFGPACVVKGGETMRPIKQVDWKRVGTSNRISKGDILKVSELYRNELQKR